MIRLPPRSTQCRSSAASDVYKRQVLHRKSYQLAPDLIDRRGDNWLASHQDICKVGHEAGRDRAKRFFHETSGTVALNGFSYLAGSRKAHHMSKGGRYKNHNQCTVIGLRVVEGLFVYASWDSFP